MNTLAQTIAGGMLAGFFAAGWDRRKALVWNAITRLACVFGAMVGHLALADAQQWLPIVLVIAAANFIYIALTGILPWLRQQREAVAWQGGFMVAGATLVPIGMKFLH